MSVAEKKEKERRPQKASRGQADGFGLNTSRIGKGKEIKRRERDGLHSDLKQMLVAWRGATASKEVRSDTKERRPELCTLSV